MNEYLDSFVGLFGKTNPDILDDLIDKGMDHFTDRYYAREKHVTQYAWAVPTPEAIAEIAKLSPIVEVGAGSGYWTKLLREAGTRVTPYDANPYPIFNAWVSFSHAAISKGGPRQALRHGREHWTLMLSWPPYADPMAAESLRLHKGEHVVYIGEQDGGCTGDDAFHELLAERYEETSWLSLPRWPGLHDYLTIWRRR